MKTQIIASIPFANANPELLYHILCTFTTEQVHELAVQNHIKEADMKEYTVMRIVEHKDQINATLNVLG